MKKLLIAALLSLTSFCSVSASVIGDEFLIEWWYGSPGDAFESQNVVVPGSWNPGYGVSDVTIGDGFITITNDATGWAGADFNGFYFTNLSQDPGFTSFSLTNVSPNAPLFAPVLSYTSNSLEVNFTPTGDGADATGPGPIHYTFAFTYGSNAAVPDGAATVGLLALAMGLMVTLRRTLVRA